MLARRFSSLITPEKREIRDISRTISNLVQESGNRWKGDPLKTALQYFMKTFEFVGVAGSAQIDDTLRFRRGNCISLSCLLASTLKSLPSGQRVTDTAVFVGCHILQPSCLHAYVLTKGMRHGYVTVVDPQFMKALTMSLERFWARYAVYLIFDEKAESTTYRSKRDWLLKLACAENERTETQALATCLAGSESFNHS